VDARSVDGHCCETAAWLKVPSKPGVYRGNQNSRCTSRLQCPRDPPRTLSSLSDVGHGLQRKRILDSLPNLCGHISVTAQVHWRTTRLVQIRYRISRVRSLFSFFLYYRSYPRLMSRYFANKITLSPPSPHLMFSR
jgi:hypothetical protein